MINDTHTDQYSNENYQQALADNLIKSLGHDNAIDACYQNDWCETLTIVLDRKRSKVFH